jgi:predicted RNase H-like HicB family nuclease
MKGAEEQSLTVRVVLDTHHGWFASVDEMRGCMTCTDTLWGLFEHLVEAIELWLEVSVEDGLADEQQATLYTRLCQEASRAELEDMAREE